MGRGIKSNYAMVSRLQIRPAMSPLVAEQGVFFVEESVKIINKLMNYAVNFITIIIIYSAVAVEHDY